MATVVKKRLSMSMEAYDQGHTSKRPAAGSMTPTRGFKLRKHTTKSCGEILELFFRYSTHPLVLA